VEAYERLEREFGQWIGNPNTVACSSGTAALHLALESLKLPPGSRVAVPEFTMVACARAVTLAGFTPWFVDCREDLLMDPELLQRAPRQVKAVMPVHVYGRRCSMDRIHKVAQDRKWAVVEDLAEAHGVQPHPQTDAACWSFYKNKIVAGEEGGMIAFRDPHAACRARKLRSLGFTDAHDFLHIPRGHNYRLANCLALLVLESLLRVDENLVRRRCLTYLYDSLIPEAWRMPPRDVDWVYDLRIPGMTTDQQDRIVYSLNAAGVAARHAFKPMSHQREFRGYWHHLVATRMAREVIYLPVDPHLTEEDVRRAVDLLLAAVPPTLVVSDSLPPAAG